MFSRFFIDRPKFALVISIVIVLVGGLSLPLLPVETHAGHHAADDHGVARLSRRRRRHPASRR